jgi:hypothetical protein
MGPDTNLAIACEFYHQLARAKPSPLNNAGAILFVQNLNPSLLTVF